MQSSLQPKSVRLSNKQPKEFGLNNRNMKIKVLYEKFKLFYRWFIYSFPLKNQFGYCGKNTVLQYPLSIYSKKAVYIEDNVKISKGLHVLNAPDEKVFIKKYTVLAANCTISTNNHVKTVTVPQFLLGASHVNDISATETIIHEDVWLGTNVTILSGVNIGRGCIVGANSLVTKSLPPYSVAIGSPARIVKKVFTVEQILKHEAALYPASERMTRAELEANEEIFFKDKGAYGTDNGLNKEALKRIISIKKLLHYIEPDI